MNTIKTDYPQHAGYNQHYSPPSYTQVQHQYQPNMLTQQSPLHSTPTPPILHAPTTTNSAPLIHKLLVPETPVSSPFPSLKYSPNSAQLQQQQQQQQQQQPALSRLTSPALNYSNLRHGLSSPASQISTPTSPTPLSSQHHQHQHQPSLVLPSIRELLNDPTPTPAVAPSAIQQPTAISIGHITNHPSLIHNNSNGSAISIPTPRSSVMSLHSSMSTPQPPQPTAADSFDLNRSNSYQQYQQLQPLTVSTLQQQHQIEMAYQRSQLNTPQTPSLHDRDHAHSRNHDLSNSRKKRQNLPRQTTLILLNWLSEHLDRPYPSSRDKYELLNETKLTIQQLDNWFINARRRKISVLRKLKENNQNIALSF